jgi:Subtilase family
MLGCAGIVDDVYGVNFVNGANGGNPQDDNGHGSFVAGVVGAVGNNAIGISGLNQVSTVHRVLSQTVHRNGFHLRHLNMNGVTSGMRNSIRQNSHMA